MAGVGISFRNDQGRLCEQVELEVGALEGECFYR